MLRQLKPTRSLWHVLGWSVAMGAYSTLAAWKEESPFYRIGDVDSELEAVLMLAIGLLLAFRINRAYDRWWEGRTLWGTLVNACRNLSIKAHNLLATRDDSIDRFEQLVVAFPYSLRDHLRGGATLHHIPGMASETADPRHVPGWIANQLYGLMEEWKRKGLIQASEFWMLDGDAKILLEVCGGCERIKNTPIAKSFRVFLNQALAFFLLTLPWVLVNDFGLWTIPLVALTSYFVIAAEGIAIHIEQPFGADGDGLDLDGLCKTIENTVHEIMATGTASREPAGKDDVP